MDLKKPVLDLRNAHILKGKYPVIVRIPTNFGHIVESKKGYYIMTLTSDNNLHFYGLSSFRLRYKKERDFEIKLNMFKNYTFIPLSKNLKEVMLINDNDFLPFRFFASVKTSYEGEANVAYMCKVFDQIGIKEISKNDTN